jgi:predicted RNA polymerase sigma factor
VIQSIGTPSLIRLLGDIDVAEEALQEVFAAARRRIR